VSLTFAPNIYPVDGQFSYEYSMSYSVTVRNSYAVALTKALIAFCNKVESVPFDRDLSYQGYSKVTFYRSPTAPTLIITPVTSQPTRSPFIFTGSVAPPTAPTASIPTASYFANISVGQVSSDLLTCYRHGAHILLVSMSSSIPPLHLITLHSTQLTLSISPVVVAYVTI
jgi:hypothetical protein